MPQTPRRLTARASGSRPMKNETRARLGGLGVVAALGPGHMAGIGRLGSTGLDRTIAAQAGIAPDAPDYEARLAAARKAYYVRLAEARWSRRRPR